ncbi:MAG: TerB family tellurite resistance protein [Bradymonadia bacterium]
MSDAVDKQPADEGGRTDTPKKSSAPQSPLDHLRQTLTRFDAKQLGDGSWFIEKLRRFNAWFMGRKTTKYHARADALRAEYPDLDDEALAKKVIQISARRAAWVGGCAGALISLAEAAATNLPFGVALLLTMGELMWLERLQSTMIFSIAGAHRYNLDPRHASDLGVLYGSMLQVKGATRVAAYSRTLAIKIFRVVGIRFSQRAAMKVAVPLISIGAGAALNYYMTLKLGQQASKRFSHAGHRERWLDEMVGYDDAGQRLLLALMMLMASADGRTKLHRRERDLLTRALDRYSDDPEVRQTVLVSMNTPEDMLLDSLKKINDEAFYELTLELMVLMATADGKVNAAEEALLLRVAEACGLPLELGELTARARAVRKEMELEESSEDEG